MSVSGPGNVDEEMELHKSLLKNVEETTPDDAILLNSHINKKNIQKISKDILEKVQRLSETLKEQGKYTQ